MSESLQSPATARDAELSFGLSLADGSPDQRLPGALPRLALSPDEAAAALGVSRDYFDEHVLPELRIVRRGRRRLVPVRELQRWLDREASLVLDRERVQR